MGPRKIIIIILLFNALSSIDLYCENTTNSIIKRYGAWEKNRITQLIITSSQIEPEGERLAYIANRFVGVPYKPGSLGGGADLEERLVIDLEGMDCLTLLTYALALTHAKDYNDFIKKVRKIRYKDNGKTLSWARRNHYLSKYLMENKEYLEDISLKLGGTIRLKELRLLEKEKIPKETVSIAFIKKENVNQIYNQLTSGDILLFTSNKRGLDYYHIGIVKKTRNYFSMIHASKYKGRVYASDLKTYLNDFSYYGLTIARSVIRKTKKAGSYPEGLLPN